jgi:phosphatidylserine/phosphatidylglycerophosphate/cardiolipin synthase-like enzyme
MIERLFARGKEQPIELLSSRLSSERDFYRLFVKDLKGAKTEVIIESPYMTVKRSKDFLPIFTKLRKRGVKIIINTRHPNHHDGNLKFQAWKAIKILRECGIKVHIHSDLRHRKLAVIDQAILWEGSLNILSQNNSREIMRRSESNQLCLQMLRFTGIKRYYW